MSTIRETENTWREQDELDEPWRRWMNGSIAIICGLTSLVAAFVGVHTGNNIGLVFAIITGVGSLYHAYACIGDILNHNRLLRDELQVAYSDVGVANARAEAIALDRGHLAGLLHDALVENDSSKTQANH